MPRKPRPSRSKRPRAGADDVITVASVPEEYERMRAARCTCGGALERGERTTTSPPDEPGVYLDRFALACEDCGAKHVMTFRVDSTRAAYTTAAIAQTRKKHGKAAADMLGWATEAPEPLALLLAGMMRGALEAGGRSPRARRRSKTMSTGSKRAVRPRARRPAKAKAKAKTVKTRRTARSARAVPKRTVRRRAATKR